jgi:uncharacterized protein
MDQNANQMIADLFTKLGQAERQTGPRDAAAEQVIAEALKQQPAAPYYMAQAILVQENALASLNRRVAELERELAERPAAGSGGFLSGLFGGDAAQTAASARPAASDREPVMPPGTSLSRGWSAQAAPARGGWSAQPQGGGGFLASAMTTAAGVAGGVLLANAVTGLFASEEAKAAEPAPVSEPPAAEPDPAMDDPGTDDLAMLDDGGDFGGFDEEF